MHVNQIVTNGSIRYYKILSETAQPAGPARAAAVVNRIFQRLLASLYETRRRQAVLFIARHRHLIESAKAVPHRETPKKNRR